LLFWRIPLVPILNKRTNFVFYSSGSLSQSSHDFKTAFLIKKQRCNWLG
jgi:hypothetical protein